MRLARKVALITGGTSGIGRATSLLFAQEGAKIAVSGRNRDRGQEVVKEITAAGGEAVFIATDVRSAEERRSKHSVESTSSSTMPACGFQTRFPIAPKKSGI
jgi:NAD(P)-dependent dehydrogenase (short-subunit alcohol dehydrogenase family)